jgi:Putative zinc-finger
MDYPLRRSCKEVASMVVAMQDRDLSLRETAELRLHMVICKACPGFEKQFLTMKSAMNQWRNYTDDVLESAIDGTAPNSRK